MDADFSSMRNNPVTTSLFNSCGGRVILRGVAYIRDISIQSSIGSVIHGFLLFFSDVLGSGAMKNEAMS